MEFINYLIDYFIVFYQSIVDTALDLLKDPWVQAIGSAASIASLICAALIGIIRLINRSQFQSSSKTIIDDENLYLERLISYLKHVNVHSSFDETYYVAREYRLIDTYQPRSFFIADHKSRIWNLLSSKIKPSDSGKKSIGFYTKNISKAVLKRNSPLVILGEPGSGKSVACRQLAMQIARQSLKTRKVNRPIPIFISLSRFSDNHPDGTPINFITFLRNILSDWNENSILVSSIILDNLARYLEQGRLFFILDSLDEMPPEHFEQRCKKLSEFFLQFNTNSFTLACRTNDFLGQISGREAHLDRLAPSEVKTFIIKRKAILEGFNWRKIYKKIKSREFELSAVIDNPFYLNLILYFISITGEFPRNLTLLYSVICTDWAEREVNKIVNKQPGFTIGKQLTRAKNEKLTSDIIARISDIAFFISNSSGFGTYAHLSALKDKFTDRIEGIIKIAAKGGMLELDSDGERVRFIHQKFQEYFTALYLNINITKGKINQKHLQKIFTNIWWEEVTIILTGIVTKPEIVIYALLKIKSMNKKYSKLEYASSRTYLLYAKCIHLIYQNDELKEKLAKHLFNQIEKVIYSLYASLPDMIDCVKALGEIHDSKAAGMLSSLLKEPSKMIRELSFSSLLQTKYGRTYLIDNRWSMGYSMYISGLFGFMSGRYSTARQSIAFTSNSTNFLWILFSLARWFLLIIPQIVAILIAYMIFPEIFSNSYGLVLIILPTCIRFVSIYTVRTLISIQSSILPALEFCAAILVFGLFVNLNMLTNPFLIAISLIMFLYVWQFGLLFVAVSFKKLCIFIESKDPDGVFIPKSIFIFLKYFTEDLSFFERPHYDDDDMFDYWELKADLMLVGVGLISIDEYVAKYGNTIRKLDALINVLTYANIGGKEVDLYEAIMDKKRLILREDTSSKII